MHCGNNHYWFVQSELFITVNSNIICYYIDCTFHQNLTEIQFNVYWFNYLPGPWGHRNKIVGVRFHTSSPHCYQPDCKQGQVCLSRDFRKCRHLLFPPPVTRPVCLDPLITLKQLRIRKFRHRLQDIGTLSLHKIQARIVCFTLTVILKKHPFIFCILCMMKCDWCRRHGHRVEHLIEHIVHFHSPSLFQKILCLTKRNCRAWWPS